MTKKLVNLVALFYTDIADWFMTLFIWAKPIHLSVYNFNIDCVQRWCDLRAFPQTVLQTYKTSKNRRYSLMGWLPVAAWEAMVCASGGGLESCVCPDFDERCSTRHRSTRPCSLRPSEALRGKRRLPSENYYTHSNPIVTKRIILFLAAQTNI